MGSPRRARIASVSWNRPTRSLGRRKTLHFETLEDRALLSGQPPVAVNDLYTIGQGDTLSTVGGSGTTIVAGGSSWSWLLPQSDPAADVDFYTTWKLPTAQFNAQYDGPGFAGPAPAPLGYGDVIGGSFNPVAYQVTELPAPPAGSRGAGYFRLDFTAGATISNVQIDIIRDDGAIIYLDGVEIGRSNMGNQADTWLLLSGTLTGTEADFHPVTPLTISSIAAGTHTLAVAVHNGALDSSDLGFDLRLKGAAGILGVVGNDTDPENDVLQATTVTGPLHATSFQLNPDGSFTYVADPAYRGPTDTFTYTVFDGTGTSNVATVTIDIIPDNFSPVAVQDRYTIAEDTPLASIPGVGTTLIPAGASWKYLDDGSDQGTSWTDPDAFDDGSWASGAAELGYGEGDEATVVSFGPDAANKYVTTYFRHSFNVADPGAFSSLSAILKRDDGVAMYLNGTEILRDNLVAGAAYNVNSIGNSDDDGQTSIGFHGLSASSLRAGTNVLAVEIHQVNGTTSDLSFDLRLIGATGTLGVLVNDTDRENDSLSAAIVTPPINAQSFTLHADGSFDYTPNEDFAGTDLFVYKANDGTSDSGNATVTITVQAVNDGPIAVDDQYQVAAGGTLTTLPDHQESIVAGGATWKYLDNGSDQGTAWRNEGFDDAGWASGAAQLGYGELDEATVVSFGPDPANKYATTYLRHTFDVPDAAQVRALALQFKRDDAISVFLNGTEVVRDNLPGLLGDNAILFSTRANGAVADDGQTFNPANPPVSAALLHNGLNLLAVELHQGAGDSSDLSFDLILDATIKSDGVMANDSDVDSAVLTAVLDVGPLHAQTFGLAADGSFTYIPEAGFTGVDTFTYHLSDGEFTSNIATVAIAVGDVISLVVTNTNDSGAGSLRAALNAANTLPGPNAVSFEIPGGGPHAINLSSNLPDLNDVVYLDLDLDEEVEVGTASTFTFGEFDTLIKFGVGELTIGGNQSHASAATLEIAGGTLNLASNAGPNVSLVANAQAILQTTQHLAHVAIGPVGSVGIQAGAGKLLEVDSLAVDPAGILDIGENDMIVHATPATRAGVLASVTARIAAGSNNLAWNGPGISSSAAATDPLLLTAVGVMLNDDGLGGAFYPDFDGIPTTANDVLVKYTYYGDADLSGQVDGTDYALIDNGFNTVLTGWFNGDFNYSTLVDGTDYALIDNAFNQQGGTLAAIAPGAVPLAGADRSSGPVAVPSGSPRALVDAAMSDWPGLADDDFGGPFSRRCR